MLAMHMYSVIHAVHNVQRILIFVVSSVQSVLKNRGENMSGIPWLQVRTIPKLFSRFWVSNYLFFIFCPEFRIRNDQDIQKIEASSYFNCSCWMVPSYHSFVGGPTPLPIQPRHINPHQSGPQGAMSCWIIWKNIGNQFPYGKYLISGKYRENLLWFMNHLFARICFCRWKFRAIAKALCKNYIVLDSLQFSNNPEIRKPQVTKQKNNSMSLAMGIRRSIENTSRIHL